MTVKLIPGIRRRQVQEHGNFVAFIGILEAVDTLAPDVIRQILRGNFLKPQAFEEPRAVKRDLAALSIPPADVDASRDVGRRFRKLHAELG